MIIIRELLEQLSQEGIAYALSGSPDESVAGFSSLSEYQDGTLAWARNASALNGTQADKIQCLILPNGTKGGAKNEIAVDDPRRVFFLLVQHFWGNARPVPGIGKNTVVFPGARIDPSASIGCNCIIDAQAVIGPGTIIEHHVVLQHRVIIGRDCVIHSGAVIGSDGFGYAFGEENIPRKIEHFGGVTIGDRVEIGANTCVDRGTIDDTRIGDDTKLDDLVHVAHNAQIGRGVLVVMGSNVCGSAVIEDRAYLAPGAIIKDGVRVGKNSFVGMGVVANRPVDANCMVVRESGRVIRNVDYHRILSRR